MTLIIDPNHTPPRNCSPVYDATHARLNSPDDNDLASILDSVYHHFDIADYLDQLQPIDDRLDSILSQLDYIRHNPDLTDLNDRITDIMDSIDNSRDT